MNELLADLNVDIELLPPGSSIREEVEWGVRWHNGVPGSADIGHVSSVEPVERWYPEEEKARVRAVRFPFAETDDEYPMWGELICRNRVTIIGPAEVV
jgi:hypothetical protein